MPALARDRTTVLVGWLVVAATLIIAVISVLIASPWNDKIPGGTQHRPLHSSLHAPQQSPLHAPPT